MLAPQDLCDAFRDRAEAVHELISYSYRRTIGVSEETVTDVTLVEIDRRLRQHVIIRKFTKHDESSLSGTKKAGRRRSSSTTSCRSRAKWSASLAVT